MEHFTSVLVYYVFAYINAVSCLLFFKT